jgi:hypothetical protein
VEQGYRLKLLLTSASRGLTLNHPIIEFIEDKVNYYQAILSLVENYQAIIGTLSLGIPASEKIIFRQSITHIIRAMNACNIRRFVVITGLNEIHILIKKFKNSIGYLFDVRKLPNFNKKPINSI